jgi:hypothetical protein
MNVLWSYSIAERMADVAVGRKALHQSIVEPSPNTPEEFFLIIWDGSRRKYYMGERLPATVMFTLYFALPTSNMHP